MPLLRGIRHAARTGCTLALLIWGFVTVINLIDEFGPNISPFQKEYEVSLVVASLKKTDVRWLKRFPDWHPQIYVVDDEERKDVPLNKGHEAMVYLTYEALSYLNRCDALF
jgi:hypothetical protein